MKANERLTDLIKASLEEAAAPRIPDYIEELLGRTARTRQRPAWTFAHSWVPALAAGRPTLSPVMRVALVLLLLGAMMAAAAVVGQQLFERRLPPPTGLARNGLLALEVGARVYLAEQDGSEMRPVPAGLAISIHPTWSPDGRKLAFWTRADQWADWSLVIANADGQRTAIIQDVRSNRVTESGSEQPIGWSPEGTQLVVEGARGQLVMLSADGSGMRTLGTVDGLWRWSPAWSPDGQWIAFKGQPVGRAATRLFGPGHGLFLIRPDGSDERRLPTSEGTDLAFERPQWLPDSSSLIYHFGHALRTSEDMGYGLALFDLSLGRERVLHDDPGHEYFPTVAPSGSLIAYLERDPADWTVVLARPDGTIVQRVQARSTAGPAVCFSPDERFLLAETHDDGDDWSLTLIPLDGSPPIKLSRQGGATAACWQRLPT